MVSDNSLNNWIAVLGKDMVFDIAEQALVNKFGSPDRMLGASTNLPIRWVSITKTTARIAKNRKDIRNKTPMLCEILGEWRSKPGYRGVRYRDLETGLQGVFEFKTKEVEL